MDNKQRIALIDTRTHGGELEPDVPKELIRYQFSNHVSSVSLELDEKGQIISYEQYISYGSTSFQYGRTPSEVKLKRYRYIGMERHEESGFNYQGVRYYILWLGRWTSADPIGLKDGINVYAYVRDNPIGIIDKTGTEGENPDDVKLNDVVDYDTKV